MHYQTGGGVQFQITFDATQLSVGTQVLQIQGMKTAVQLSLRSKDVVSGALLSGLTYAVYADYTDVYMDCTGTSCGTEVSAGSDS